MIIEFTTRLFGGLPALVQFETGTREFTLHSPRDGRRWEWAERRLTADDESNIQAEADDARD